MILLTPVIFGASIGIMIYPYLPRPVITCLLLAMILGAIVKSYMKGMQVHKKETDARKKPQRRDSQILEDDVQLFEYERQSIPLKE